MPSYKIEPPAESLVRERKADHEATCKTASPDAYLMPIPHIAGCCEAYRQSNLLKRMVPLR